MQFAKELKIGSTLILVSDQKNNELIITKLLKLGYNVEGYLDGGVEAWKNSGRKMESINQIIPEDFKEIYNKNENIILIDVRNS